MSLFVCLLVCLFACLFVCLFVCVCVCMFVCSFVRSFVRLFVCLPVCSFVCLYYYTRPSIRFTRLSIRLFACMLVCAFVSIVRCSVRVVASLFVLVFVRRSVRPFGWLASSFVFQLFFLCLTCFCDLTQVGCCADR